VKRQAAHVAAQAKLNLLLHVIAQERTGYHQIETLFCRLALADDVVVRIAAGWSVDVTGADVGPPEENLALRAAKLYAQERGWPSGCAIEVTKRIPVGGGLGGGSADAAGVLRALQALDPTPPPKDAIIAWGARLGADVPALTVEAPLAVGWGRGDRLLALPPLPRRGVLLAIPPVAVSTRDAYGWLAVSRPEGFRLWGRAIWPDDLADWDRLMPHMANDFEAVVYARCPEIAGVAQWLARTPGVSVARLSGSGSTVFALGDGARAPRPAAPPPGTTCIETETADHVVGVRRIE
jgi:4-diphosphocytidyl-2-C-methyl-D-erythritol kinase